MTATKEGVNHHNWPIKVLLLNVFYVLSVVCIGPIKILTALTILTEHGNGKLHNLLSKGNYLWFYRSFHGRGRHLGSGANAAKFAVNVWEKS